MEILIALLVFIVNVFTAIFIIQTMLAVQKSAKHLERIEYLIAKQDFRERAPSEI
jgi:hypothetical protein